jgi:diguanylate cyclase
MKTTRVTEAPHLGAAPRARAEYLRSTAQRAAVNTAPLRLQLALAQVEELNRALASSQRESAATRQQIARLRDANAWLREFAEQREQEVRKARHFAYHDELTGLPNRALLADRLNQALVRAKRQDVPLALLLLDLDGFKHVNDRLGHGAGDQLLRQVAARLLSCIRGSDTACRYGGDEFVLLLPEVDGVEQASQVADKIRARLAIPYVVAGYSITVTASVGVAVYPVDGLSKDALIERADVAMYLAKTARGSSRTRAKTAVNR